MEEFNDSLPVDKNLWREEIKASSAYAVALAEAQVFSRKELALVQKAFHAIEKEFSDGKFTYRPGDEDIHTAIERRLVEKVGAIGKRIHSGRSRNEQVVTDERIFLKNTVDKIIGVIAALQNSTAKLASDTVDDIVPSYTHMQQAQLIRLGHYFMSLFFMLENDIRRFMDLRKRIDVLPLGSGAVAGSTLKLNRNILKKELNFASLSPNSIAAVSDRDFIGEFLFAAAQTLIHLSRYAEDLIVWNSAEFRFVELDDMYSTGSSMMPQKKNPDSLELIRGKAARAIANLNSLLVLQKGLPLTYSKDLQEDKEALFDSVETLVNSLRVFDGVISTLKIKRQNLSGNVDDSIYATDIADYLTERGTPFRDAHSIVGKLVLLAIDQKKRLKNLTIDEIKSLSDKFSEDYYQIFDPEKSVERHDVYGGTSLRRVNEQIRLATRILSEREAGKK